MKKLVIILLLFILTTSCNKYVAENMFERTYPGTEFVTVKTDVYSQMRYYEVDSIPLNKWVENKMIADTTVISQKFFRKIEDKNTYTFVLTEYTYPSGIKYQFVIRYYGKKK